jgi:tetratricopeptide (TPR) repeat protein
MEIGNFDLLGLYYSNLSKYHSHRKHYDKSIKYVNKAIKIFNISSNTHEKAKNLVQLGLTLRKKNQLISYQDLMTIYPQIISNFNEAYEIFCNSGDLKNQINHYNNLGLVNLDIRKYNEGLQFFQKEYILAEKIDDEYLMVQALANMADCYLITNNLNKSEELFKKALKKSENYNWPIYTFIENRLKKISKLSDNNDPK